MVYFDNAASTPVDERVLKAMEPFWDEHFGNPSSVHVMGQEARKTLKNARKVFADFLRANPDEIIFTSGATESDNLAIKGIIKGALFKEGGKCVCCSPKSLQDKPHIITLKIEHYAILKPCEEMERMGMAEADFLSVEPNGIVDAEKVKSAIKDNTRLISIMIANNEIGTIQPIKEISKIIQEENKKREEESKIYFHTDAAQGYSLDMDVKNLGVDLLSLSAHKFYGPKGAGILYIKKSIPFMPIINGGAQEMGMRAGTQNIPAIVGAAKAVEFIGKNEFIEIGKLRDLMIARIESEIKGVKLNGSKEKRVCGNANFSFSGIEGESLMILLNDAGFAVSTGSACTTGVSAVSYTLRDLGLSVRDAHSSIRITLGRQNTIDEVNEFVEALKISVQKLRGIAGKNIK